MLASACPAVTEHHPPSNLYTSVPCFASGMPAFLYQLAALAIDTWYRAVITNFLADWVLRWIRVERIDARTHAAC